MRLFITGVSGSGKADFARRISEEFNIPMYQLDEIHWVEDGPHEEKLKKIHEINNQDSWIIEGAQFKWSGDSIKNADHIIVFDNSSHKNRFRIIKKYIKQKLGLEKSHYKPSTKVLNEKLRLEEEYNSYKDDLVDMLIPYGEKVFFVRNEDDLYKIDSKLKGVRG